jgi:hypothetical protein
MTKEELKNCIQIQDYKVYIILQSCPGNRIVAFEDIKTWMMQPLECGSELSTGVVVYLHSSLHPVYTYLSRRDMQTLWFMAQKECYRQIGIQQLRDNTFHSRAELLVIDKDK